MSVDFFLHTHTYGWKTPIKLIIGLNRVKCDDVMENLGLRMTLKKVLHFKTISTSLKNKKNTLILSKVKNVDFSFLIHIRWGRKPNLLTTN